MSWAPREQSSAARWSRLGRCQARWGRGTQMGAGHPVPVPIPVLVSPEAAGAGWRDAGRWGRWQPRRPPLGTTVAAGHPEVSVVDPDMEALFDEFLGKEGSGVSRPEAGTLGQPPRQPYHYRVRDTDQKVLCLEQGRLVATSLQGANAAREELISVVPNRHLERSRYPLIVGIRGGSRALSCGTGPQPQLQIEDVPLLELFSWAAGAERFTFYKSYSGSTHSFEAAAFPGHFLSTAPRAGEALALTARPGHAGAITTFYLEREQAPSPVLALQ